MYDDYGNWSVLLMQWRYWTLGFPG
jgi:hypothetical protein